MSGELLAVAGAPEMQSPVKWAALMALVTSLVACSGNGGQAAADVLTTGVDRRIEGRVIAVDVTPMFVDGDGEITLQTVHHGRILIRIPAREQLCHAKGLAALSSLVPGDSIRLMGRITRPDEVTVCVEETHFLEKIAGD
jgi:hypothetical protein